MLISLECNKLPLGIRNGSIEVSKTKYMQHYISLCVCNKTNSKEIHPGEPPFSRANGFGVVPGKYRQHYQQ